jgi:hypothetical protein
MRDKPSGDLLMEAVARFLRDELLPQLDATSAFKTRVAANALDIAIREMRGDAAADAAEVRRLASLLGRDGDLAVLNSELCTAIRTGDMTLATPGLSEHLWATTLDKLAIEQPTYASYRRALETRAKGEAS